MSDLENRVYGLEAIAYDTKTNADRALIELTQKADRWEFDELRSNYLQRICYLEDKLYKVMAFLEQNWGITNVDDLI